MQQVGKPPKMYEDVQVEVETNEEEQEVVAEEISEDENIIVMEEEANEAASSNEEDKEVSYTTERSKSASLYKASNKTTTSISQK